ncbi:uncharacterized protein DDB_G0288805-like [Teleopsis dalmanni]|uniref:uncharacterized protein DDB_G0288805-like n=1 Tax=Teleopsis dalmanni TaxID=139649 RepID=UPI0018CEAD08|nr:uncharacterized protein DDB_G0288805-like [Teleopsis dalmanni]
MVPVLTDRSIIERHVMQLGLPYNDFCRGCGSADKEEIERYKTDINLAIQLLQCKPDSFMPQKVSSLPIDIQSKVSAYMRLETNSHSDSEGSTSGVGVATSASYKVLPASDSPPPAPCPFPPTAMVYSMRGLGKYAKNNVNNITNNNNNSTSKENSNTNSNNNNINNNTSNICNSNTSLNNNSSTNGHNNDPDMISPVLMAKFLEDELKASEVKHCDTCQCAKQDLTVLADVSRSYTVSTQTPFAHSGNLNEPLTQLCLRCNSNLNSPSRTNSPYLMKLVKSSDSVISETKSSVSDLNDMDKLFLPAKKDDLMVNPILGHHRLCERTNGSGAISQQNGALVTNSKLSSMLYTSSQLDAYAAEKYLMEVTSLAGVKNGYQRRFLEGGGTALELLGKYEPTNAIKQENLNEINGNDELEDEAKPLLSAVSQTNLLETEKPQKVDVSDINNELIKTPASSCSAANVKNNLLRTTISGSVNSLWSKTSSCEGAKMFENFNRNLIKTIKAENPKYRGPRLCAMRIQQNGQSNILLDNIESMEAVTPIIYRRRERLLDEELDDTKDIITSNSTRCLPNVDKLDLIESVEKCSNSGTGEILDPICALSVTNDLSTSECKAIMCNNNEVIHVAGCNGETKGGGLLDEINSPSLIVTNVDSQIEQKTGKTDIEMYKDIKSNLSTDKCAELKQEIGLANLVDLTSELQQQLDKTSSSFEILQNEPSSKNSLNSKSCTQSSSVSDVIDFQESVILRRQQLSRVAEWVQNNTQQLEQQQQVINAMNHCDSSGTDRQSSFSTIDQLDSVSMEKLSMDSGYKTTPQPQTNGYSDNQQDETNKSTEDSLSPKTEPVNNHTNINNNINKMQQTPPLQYQQQQQQQQQPLINTAHTFYRRTTRSGLPVAYTTSDLITHNGSTCNSNTPTLPEQPTCDILNYKYYPSETDKTRAIKAELHTTTQNVDIAQMEYNVKQFLLKQNEWSMHCSRTNNSNSTGTIVSTGSQLHSNGNIGLATTQKLQTTGKNLRHMKLFSGAGIGPGVGERVRVTTTTTPALNANQVIATTITAPSSATTGNKPVVHTIPQRTETNL